MWNEGSRSLHWPKLEMFRAIKANPIKHMNHCKPHVHLSRLQTWSCGIITWKLQALNAWLLAAHCNAYGGMSCGIITWKRQALNARLLAAHCTAYGGMSCGIITWSTLNCIWWDVLWHHYLETSSSKCLIACTNLCCIW